MRVFKPVYVGHVTEQAPDSVEVDGVPYRLIAQPLDALLGPNPPFVAPSTALWRGYLAAWAVRDDRLYLTGVSAWVLAADGSSIAEVDGSAMFRPWNPPVPATWVTGDLLVEPAVVNSDSYPFVLSVEQGTVTSRRPIEPPPPPSDAVGPYTLGENILGPSLSGGGFASIYEVLSDDGQLRVGKVARPRGGASGTEMWADDFPVHVPAGAYVQGVAGSARQDADAALLAAALENERQILAADDGAVFPRLDGMWPHARSGATVLVMERLAGRRPQTAEDVYAVLRAVEDLVDRGVVDAHGDLKFEHVFISNSNEVRLCDPAPRFGDPKWRGYTRAFNPNGWIGAAADVVACASMIRYLKEDVPAPVREWAEALLSEETPPRWALRHRDALGVLDYVMRLAPQPGARPVGGAPDEEWPPVDVTRLRSQVPVGWERKESHTLFAPSGQANVIASNEPLGRQIDSATYASTQGELLRREFPGYREHAFGPAAAFGRPGFARTFTWTPPDGVRVTQIQHYVVVDGRGYTATATTPSTLFEMHKQHFEWILSRLSIGEPFTAPPDGAVRADGSPTNMADTSGGRPRFPIFVVPEPPPTAPPSPGGGRLPPPRFETAVDDESANPYTVPVPSDHEVDDDAASSEWERPAVTLDDVAGLDPVKQRIEAVVLAPLRHPELARQFARRASGGMLLWGAPGCGKTFVAKAIAGEMQVNFSSVGLDQILDSLLGNSEKGIARMFADARRRRPSVLFLDEIDALGLRRSRQHASMRPIVNTLLSELDGVASDNDGVFVIGATNTPWDIDPALRRPGRFDRVIFVPPPDRAARTALLAARLAAHPLGDVDLPAIAKRTAGYSGADLAHLAESAVDLAFAASVKTGSVQPIVQEHLTSALRDVLPSITDWTASAEIAATASDDAALYGPFLEWLKHRDA